MTQIVGFVRKTGAFEKDGKSINYDNYNVFYLTDENSAVVGMGVGECKCPVAKLKILGAKDIAGCVGKKCSLYVDANSSRFRSGVPTVTTIIVQE